MKKLPDSTLLLDLDIPVRLCCILRFHAPHLKTVGDIRRTSDKELADLPNFGKVMMHKFVRDAWGPFQPPKGKRKLTPPQY